MYAIIEHDGGWAWQGKTLSEAIEEFARLKNEGQQITLVVELQSTEDDE